MIDDLTKALIHKLNTMTLPSSDQAEIVHAPEAVKEKLFERVFPPAKVEAFLKNLPEANARAIVVANGEGITEWVSPAFTRMCGYSLEELRGRKTGGMLQGANTQADSVEMLRTAVRERRPVKVKLVNYHKLGSPYEVEIALSPTFSVDGDFTGFIAVENEV